MARAIAFYDAVMGALGHAGRAADPAGAWAGWFTTPAPATVGNGVTIAFEAADRATVERFHAAALAHGGTDEGPPGLRPYHAHDYGAYVRDPDGNKLCCVCHRPP
jgi:catechol 2,3-dioxygenase-like lactoylglutathione lyase family enzyme